MRIVDEWTKHDIRVTVFHMNGRYSIKLEKDLLEQTYKFRDGQFEQLDDLKMKLNDAFYSECDLRFEQMNSSRLNLISAEEDFEFDKII